MRKHSPFGFTLLLIGAISLSAWGCATTPPGADPAAGTPRLTVSPTTVTLGVAKIMGTRFTFQGSGFPAGENVIIAASGPKDTYVTLALARVNPDGTFFEEMSDGDTARLVKATAILKADITRNEKMEAVLVISRPAIPVGKYKVTATSMIKNVTAEAALEFDEPSGIDFVMDWLGKVTGKIAYK